MFIVLVKINTELLGWTPPGTCLPLLFPLVLDLLGYLFSPLFLQHLEIRERRQVQKERMGHGSSKELPETTNTEGGSTASSRIKRPHISRVFRRLTVSRGNGSSSSALKLVSAEDFAGIALLTLISADMQQFKDKWLACVSFGEQTFRTHISDQTEKPVWNSEKKLLLEKNGPRLARISVFETNRISKNNLVGYCEIDLLELLTQESDSDFEVFELFDPAATGKVVGRISLSCSVEDPIETEKNFARRILAIMDYNEDGKLSFSEFSDLIKAFGNQVAENKKEELFKAADKNGDDAVSMDELAELLAFQQEKWMFKLSEWAHFSSYDVGLNSGSSASHILVFDRKTKRLVEELIDKKIVLSMRAIYQSKIGLHLMDKGAKEILLSISEKQGREMNTTESAGDIPKFVEFFKDQINLAEVKYPLEHFKTFNEFFIRELKPGTRPIASMERDDVAICAADSRLMAFKSVEDGQRFWIKGRKFSVQGLLGKETYSSAFADGTLVIFRLAPQDYHRFHSPVSGTIEKFVKIPGCLYTVNPIAVNSKYCNVFTENKREVSIISTAHFGKVAFVAIGATMVGSITFSKKAGDHVKKGDEYGYFSFGGSTVICVFEKDAIEIDEDLLANSARSLETLVSVGMKLGVATNKQAKVNLPNFDNWVLEE
ncbi:PREDICTED: phosphatidylserine decarboxylase proenzyme 3-like isoform X3 [Populus euphratica]|uniref:Phosphatidylserine decarboxylase proenzyme 2 n=1 Tax=Populus euphratica TaxID=75702 RepID=A0AAJ6UTJ9_POPEU|nr:PREDICTED: phosphatidylserine decarboxylase proenzyme 3-like isoform X3 [Populus euphratica]